MCSGTDVDVCGYVLRPTRDASRKEADNLRLDVLHEIVLPSRLARRRAPASSRSAMFAPVRSRGSLLQSARVRR
jgi:hypothetical protein